ncbi:hypothetical protein HDU86_002169 [Geranomyces michiganensis]|nr:hypothetical protein HDU86_002169 [Geranomyces michiganensis]
MNGDLTPVAFAKYRCTGLDEKTAKEQFQKCVRIAIAKIKRIPNLAKPKMKAAAANIWSEDNNAWGLYWENLRLKRLRTRNQLKRLAHGEESLTESVKKARTMEQRSRKDDTMMHDLLSSGAWKLVPISSGPTTPWVSALEQIAQTLMPDAQPKYTQVIDVRTTSPEIGKFPRTLAESYAALNDEREEIVAKMEQPEDQTNAKLL